MTDINKVVMVARLVRDAELKYSSGGMAICRFAIAVNRRKKQGDEWKDEASFFDVVLFGKSGESVNQYLTKGKQVAIEGELHQDRWEKDGEKKNRVEIYANTVQLLGGGKQGEKSEPAKQADEAPEKGGDFDDDVPW